MSERLSAALPFVTQMEERIMNHQIEITHAKRVNERGGLVGIDSYFASYNGERTGEYREPLCAGARWLLAHGHAAPDDTVVMCRNGKPAMSGNVGKLAKLTLSTAAYFTQWDGGPDDLTPRPLSEQTLAVFAKGRAALAARRRLLAKPQQAPLLTNARPQSLPRKPPTHPNAPAGKILWSKPPRGSPPPNEEGPRTISEGNDPSRRQKPPTQPPHTGKSIYCKPELNPINLKEKLQMSDDPVNQNADVIQSARGIRRSPSALAQIAALNAADAAADPSVAGLGTMTGTSSPGGHHWTPDSQAPSSSRLAVALANTPTPPPRPADLGGALISALASPPQSQGVVDPSIAAAQRGALAVPQLSGNPQQLPRQQAPQVRALANPPPSAGIPMSISAEPSPAAVPSWQSPASNPNWQGQANQMPLTALASSPIAARLDSLPPPVASAPAPAPQNLGRPPVTAPAQVPAQGGWQSGARLVPTDEQPAQSGWQPPATDRVAGTPTAEMPATPGARLGSDGSPEYLTPRSVSQVGQDLDDVVRNSTFGFGDKLAAWGNSMLGNGYYPSNLAAERAKSQAALERTGPVPSMVATLPLGGGIAKGAEAFGAAAEGVPLLGRVLGAGVTQGAGTGAAIGGLNAAGNDQDVGTGALYGAGAGLAGVPLGWAAGQVAGGVANKVANSAFNKTNGAGLTANAADKLSEALASQDQTPAQAVAAAQAMGPGATLADAGPATQNLTSRLAAQEPTVAPVIAENLKARAEQLAPRINNVVDQAIGPDFSAPEKLAGLKVATRLNGNAYGPILNSQGRLWT